MASSALVAVIRTRFYIVIYNKNIGSTPDAEQESAPSSLADGLAGVKHIDMLEIQIDNALRYVASGGLSR